MTRSTGKLNSNSDRCKNAYELNSEKLPLMFKQQQLTQFEKYAYTIIHLFIHLTFGLTLSSMAPAFVDFKHLLNTSMGAIGLVPTFQSIGTLVGTAFTIFYKYVNRQLILFLLVIGMATGTIFEPWSTQLWHLYACIFLYGVGIGAWNGANNVILIEMWQNNSPSILQFSQFIYGCGTILGPLLTKNYVIGEMVCPGVYPKDCATDSSKVAQLNSTRLIKEMSNNTICTEECLTYDRRPALTVPFLIGGMLHMIGALLLVAMYCIKKYHYNQDSRIEVVVTDEQVSRHKEHVPRKTIITCVTIFLAFGIMSENMYMDFSATFFQYQRTLRLSAETSALIFSTMSVSLSVGRGLSVFVAMFIKPEQMIAYQLVIVFLGYIFQIFGQDDFYLLWTSSILICFGYSSIFICLFSFVGQYMEVTDKIGGLFIASYNVIYLFLPYYISYYIEILPESFLYIELLCLSVAIVSFIVVMVSVRNVPIDLIRRLGPLKD